MSKILFINACARESSRTLSLAGYVLSLLGGEVEEERLYDLGIKPLCAEGIRERDLAFETGDFSAPTFELARRFVCAETVVIAAPYWDLMFPSILKNYFEAITVNGLSFVYSDKGFPCGLCSAKRLIYVTTAGGPIMKNFGYEYTEALARTFYGINDVRCISAERLDIHGSDVESIMLEAKESAKRVLRDVNQ